MPYRVPDGSVNAYDTPDPEVLNRMVRPAVEELSSKLNDHNVKSGSINAGRRADTGFMDFYTARVAADTGINTNANDVPDTTSANAWRVPDGGEWTTVDQMSVSFTAGEDKVWAIGWVQYGVVPDSPYTFNILNNAYGKPRLQFALRVEGAVLPHTITGLAETNAHPRPVMPVTPFIPATPADNESVDSLRLRGTSSMGWHVNAVRVQCSFDVPQGSPTIELVVRRMPPDDPSAMQTNATVAVYCYSRMLVVCHMKRTSPTVSPSTTPVSVVYPDATSALSAAALNTNMLAPLRTAINDLNSGSVQQYGLRRDHLPNGKGAIRQAQQTSISTGTTTNRIYPGWASAGTVGVGNWAEVSDGGTNLRVTGPWDYSTTPAFVLILANVAHRKANNTAVAASAEQYGVYAIAGQYSTGPTDFHSSSAEVFVNNPSVTPNWGAGYPTLFDCDCDIPLMDFFDYRTSPPAGGAVSFYRVLSSFCSGAGGPNVEWQAGSIQVLHFFP